MARPGFDSDERALLCDLLEALGPDAPTVLDPWTTRDVAVHLYLREHDAVAGPGLVVPGPWARVAERHHRRAATRDYGELVEAVRAGPRGVFRLAWMRRVPNLNELFVHHEDVRRANDLAPRELGADQQEALWRNAVGGGWLLTRRVSGCGIELVDALTGREARVRRGAEVVRIVGRPDELLLFLFGRQRVARVELEGTAWAVARLGEARLGV